MRDNHAPSRFEGTLIRVLVRCGGSTHGETFLSVAEDPSCGGGAGAGGSGGGCCRLHEPKCAFRQIHHSVITSDAAVLVVTFHRSPTFWIAAIVIPTVGTAAIFASTAASLGHPEFESLAEQHVGSPNINRVALSALGPPLSLMSSSSMPCPWLICIPRRTHTLEPTCRDDWRGLHDVGGHGLVGRSLQGVALDSGQPKRWVGMADC